MSSCGAGSIGLVWFGSPLHLRGFFCLFCCFPSFDAGDPFRITLGVGFVFELCLLRLDLSMAVNFIHFFSEFRSDGYLGFSFGFNTGESWVKL